ncbi:MAG: hypothetical protein SNJ75_11575 [Gemmataceae bacterium]
MKRQSIYLLGFFVPCLILGCGSSGYYPVSGKATYKGEPMVGAQLFFHPVNDKSHQAIRPGAQVKDDGSYELMTMGKRGAPAGEYRITVYWSGPKKDGGQKKPSFGGGAEQGGGPNFIKPPYSDPDNSPLKATIQAGTNNIPVEIN